MQRTSFRDMSCSIAQCLDVVGEWWSLLLVRDAFLGYSRFDQFQERLGISRNVLNQRLGRLVDEGIFERVPYQQNPVRYDYRLTEKGRDLWNVVGAMRAWGTKWGDAEALAGGEAYRIRHAGCGGALRMQVVCTRCEQDVTSEGAEYLLRDPAPAPAR
jgi:DNA-binding HxlR family transcriptional regulator